MIASRLDAGFQHLVCLGYEALAFPYGIGINPKDGSVGYAIEGGVPSYICIDPTGGEKDKVALSGK